MEEHQKPLWNEFVEFRFIDIRIRNCEWRIALLYRNAERLTAGTFVIVRNIIGDAVAFDFQNESLLIFSGENTSFKI